MMIAGRTIHPKHLLIGGAAIAAIVVIAVVVLIARRASEAKASYVPTAITRGDIAVEILSTGIVSPENRLEIKPPIAGRVEEVLVDEGQPVKKGQVLARMSSTERAALLDAATARSAGDFERWQSFYRAAPILAPIDGTIIARNVEPGQSFTTADAVFVMSDRLTVKAQVDETDIANIALRQRADVTLDAYPDQHIPSHVDQIAYDATTVNNVTTYIVDVLPETTPEFMRSGMTANVSFAISSKEGILVLPVSAVKTRDGRSVVLIPPSNPMSAPVEKEVEAGLSNGKFIEIVAGLAEGDIVFVPQSKKGSGQNGATSPFTPFRPRAR